MVAGWCLLALSSVAMAQTPPNIGDAVRQVPVPSPSQAPSALPPIGGTTQAIEPPLARLPGGSGVAVTAIAVVGNRVIDTPELVALVAEGVGRTLDLAGLESLAQRITRYYRVRGYFVARAYLPAQDITDGKVRIRVVEGNYGQFHLHNQSRVDDRVVQGMLDAVKRYDIVSVDTLERAMLIINDTPGARVSRADVMPGEKVGTSDFAVDTVATPAYDGYALLDNYGSVYTGRDRLSFNLAANSPSGGGDRLSLSGLATEHAGLLNGRIAYSALLLAQGLRGELAASQTHYQLGDAYAALDAAGSARGVDANLTYPLRRVRVQTIELSAVASYKDLVDEVRSTGLHTPKRSVSATLGVSVRDERTVLAVDGKTLASATLSHGDLSIGSASALALDESGARSNGGFTKLVLAVDRASVLPAQFTLTLSGRLQQTLSHGDLDGSERMAVSGDGGVLAYPPGELVGDDARFARVALSRPLPPMGGAQASWSAFADTGNARDARPLAAGPERHLSDVGLGVDGSLKGAVLHACLAHRMPAAPAISEPVPRNRFLVQAGWTF